MELDQLIFQKLFRFWKKQKKVDPLVSARTIKLDDIKPKLIILARALTGKPIDILGASRDGGWQNNTFFLPVSFNKLATAKENLQFYMFRLCYLYVQQKKAFNWQPNENQTPEESILQAEKTSEQVLSVLFQEFEILAPLHQKIKQALEEEANKQAPDTTADFTWLYGHWMKNSMQIAGKDLEHINKLKQLASQQKITTEIKAKAADEVETIQVDKKAQEDFTLQHHFEKVDTAEEFNGVWRDFDGDDSLEKDAEALDELNLKQTVRVDDPVHSVYQADFAGNLTIAESKETQIKGSFIAYPEWDFANRRYKQDFCKVFPSVTTDENIAYYTQTLKANARVLRNLKKRFAQMDNALEIVRRQPSGDDFDIDAVTDMYADIVSKHTPNEKIYLSKRKQKKDLSILFLLDLSLSSDGYVNGNRVLDIEKQVMIILGEALDDSQVEFEIAGFSSKTRNYCAFTTIKPFKKPWAKSKHYVGAVEPSGYTRIGPALRHAGARLKQQSARKKWLVLLSDGKPNDYDKYEGKYGVQDVKQALRELNAENINTYAVAIEDQARYYLPQMFGQNHYSILSSPVEMIQSLAKLYEKIERN
ncbi:MAG: VWA domain-containing protein [Cyclobacteriaceae bacterium]|nr:VWA domain-containing protein [Cyclobacteriaceae bacterium]